MARGIPFHWVDVFAAHPLSGNPVALVPDADELTDAQMRAIAREFNQSETTFILRPTVPAAAYRLRSFTPIGAEVGGAGHNVLGAWLWLAEAGRLPSAGGAFVQEIGAELLAVEVGRADDGRARVSLDQTAPHFGACVEDRTALALGLGLEESDLTATTPAQVVSTGAGHLLVEIAGWRTVDRIVPHASRLAEVLRDVDGEGCYVYSTELPEAIDAAAYARFFNPTMGIAEDPATGTAAGPLAAFLMATGRAAPNGTLTIEQGHALGRPSRIEVSVHGDQVRVSGSGVVAASGTLAI